MMQRFGLNGHSVIGLGSTFTDAQKIAVYLMSGYDDPGGLEAAYEILAQYVGSERTLVANKAIALGADPTQIRIILQGLGAEGGEVIEIVDTKPKLPLGRLAIAGALMAGLGAGLVAYSKRRAARA